MKAHSIHHHKHHRHHHLCLFQTEDHSYETSSKTTTLTSRTILPKDITQV